MRALLVHEHEGIGELKLVAGADIVVDIVLQGVDEGGDFFDFVEPDQGEIRFGDTRFFDQTADGLVVAKLDYPEIARVFHLFHAQARMRAADNIGEIAVENNIAQDNQNFCFIDEALPRRINGVSQAEPLLLIDKFDVEIGVTLLHVSLYFIAQVADDQDDGIELRL